MRKAAAYKQPLMRAWLAAYRRENLNITLGEISLYRISANK
jgi:hypothetical protein